MDTIAICCLLLLACLGRCAYAEGAEEMGAPRIYHGKPVNITEVPFMARLHHADVQLSCGAVIVHERFLLSAAHCYNPNAIVRVGSDNLKDGSGQDYTIEKMFVHPKRDLETGEYDLLVIKLKTKMALSERVQPIKMADPDIVIEDGEMMDTVGFGHTEHGTLADQLLKIDVPLYNQKKCKKYIKRTINMKIKKSMICAGGVGYEDVCRGDSGEPLRYKDIVVGLSSSIARPCTVPNNPNVYARVSIMRPFIDEVIEEHS